MNSFEDVGAFCGQCSETAISDISGRYLIWDELRADARNARYHERIIGTGRFRDEWEEFGTNGKLLGRMGRFWDEWEGSGR